MRIAVVADIHGNLLALERVREDLATRAPDLVLNLGDSVTSPLWPRETWELLETLGWATLRGNHDRWLTELAPEQRSPSIAFTHAALSPAQREALWRLPPALTPAPGVLAVHGTPASDTGYLLEDLADGRLALARPETVRGRLGGTDAGLVLCGHSHLQHLARIGGTVVLNPGSVGCPRYADNADPGVAEAGAPLAHYAVVTARQGRWDVELLALAYGWEEVARRATASGRPDWAAGFLR